MNLFSRMTLLGATALVGLSLPAVIEPAAAIEATVVKGATPQLSRQADDAAAFKKPKKKTQPKKK